MKNFGFLLAIAGLFIALGSGLFYHVSVPGAGDESEIINIGLQQNQLMMFQFGLATLLAGVVLYGVGVLDERLGEGAGANIASSSLGSPSAGQPDAGLNSESNDSEPKDIQALMDSAGVTWDGEKYVFGAYRYDRLEDALAFARMHPNVP